MDNTQLTTEADAFAAQGLAQFAPYLMNRIVRRYNSRVEADVRDMGLNVPRLRILAALVAQGPQSINSLSVYSVSEQSTTSRIIEAMEIDGFVERSVSEVDQRSRIVSLTQKGSAAFETCFPIMRAGEAAILEGFTQAERALALELLGRMLNNVRETEI